MDIKNVHLVLQNRFTSKRIFTISLTLALITLVVSASSTSLQFIRPAMAASLSGVAVVPTSNIVNERSTYDFFFTTKTTGTIKTIVINFPSGFTLNIAKLIERSGIGSGSLSAQGQSLVYTVSSSASISAGTTIRLEIGRIIATSASSSFTVSIITKNTGGGTIDGPTNSGVFTIKSIMGNDVSSSFMVRKTLLDDAAGHAHGWDPNGGSNPLFVSDSDISGSPDSIFVSVMVLTRICATSVINTDAHIFTVLCNNPPPANSNLDYEIHKLPAHVVTSSLSVSSSSPSSPFDSQQVDK